MAKFVLIDHSLKRPGGHHFEYAVQILHAAAVAGFDIILATHRRFRSRDQFPASWQIAPLFQFATYNPYTIYCSDGGQLQHADRPPRSLLERFRHWRWRRGRENCVASFARSCSALFQAVALQDGDQVFLPTMSEVDLAGLTRFLRRSAGTRCADWHVQFHFNIFDGREPEYAEQLNRLASLRSQFQDAAALLTTHRLHFYSTTQQLADQYNRLEGPNFSYLPYPVNPAFAPALNDDENGATNRSIPLSPRGRGEGANVQDTSTPHPRPLSPKGRGETVFTERPTPLRITCGGAIRAEKNPGALKDLISVLWHEYFATGQLQLAVQSNKRKFRLPLPATAAPNLDPVVYLPHPLPSDAYVDYIRTAGVGVFYYDSERYYARHGGILGEFLAAGVPVIVPAGCWLAEQITAPILQHHRDTMVAAVNSRSLAAEPEQLHAIPPGTGAVLLTLDWLQPNRAGMYLHMQIDQYRGAVLQNRTVQVLGRQDEPLSMLVNVADGADHLSFTCRNAYHAGAVTVSNARLKFLDRNNGPSPMGAVGLIAADASHIPQLVQEIWQHYAHYRRTALAFSSSWLAAHHPGETFKQLLLGTGHKRRHAA